MKPINVTLAVVVVAVLIGCGGDYANTRPGSTEEKLCGDWEADPVTGLDDVKHTTRTVDIVFLEGMGGGWNDPGLVATYREEVVPTDGLPPSRPSVHEQPDKIRVNGMTATADSSRTSDRSTWVFRLDPDQPDVLYVTWTLKDGTRRLDEVKFRKKR